MTRWIAPALLFLAAPAAAPAAGTSAAVALNRPDTGYRGIWYMNQPTGDAYAYKYSGGLGTYCSSHNPFAVYCPETSRTFFCYGGATPDSPSRLVHMVSYFDHRTGLVPRPTLLLDKHTDDAHDNPVLAVDDRGFVWVFSTSHGKSRPSFVHRSRAPYAVDAFDRVDAVVRAGAVSMPLTNFSYLQAWHAPGRGFACFLTRYGEPAARTLFFMGSADGVTWDRWVRLAAIEEGHYQVSALGRGRAGTAFNHHPRGKGLNYRTNLYYLETPDLGRSWTTAGGEPVALPVTRSDAPVRVHDYAAEGLNVYLMDLAYDEADRPVILYLTSRGWKPGPACGPCVWRTAAWTGSQWELREVTGSDHSYDMGSLYLETGGVWRTIGPTDPGPQPFGTGGEIVCWTSRDRGATWTRMNTLTAGSARNHTYARRPVPLHPDFAAFWADGDARRPSESRLYFADHDGRVFGLPPTMDGPFARPDPVPR